MTEGTDSGTELVVDVPDPDAMGAFGARLAGLLRAGDVVVLDGELGAGKTTLTRGLGAALGVRGAVTSPTFVLARTHPRRDPAAPPLVHVDAYRLGSALELDDLDLDLTGSITVVEWGAGLVERLVDEWLRIRIDRPRGADALEAAPAEGDERPDAEADADADADAPVAPRRIRVTGVGARWASADLDALRP